MKIIKGIGASYGIAHAKILYFEKIKGERCRGISETIEKTLEKVRFLRKKAMHELGEKEAKIFDAYEMLLTDPILTEPIINAVKNGGDEETAIKNVTEKSALLLEKNKNEYMRQRAEDIIYIGTLLCDTLNGRNNFEFPGDDEKYIIAAHNLTPVDTVNFPSERLAGLVCESGGVTSHTAILAKSIGIPAVVGVYGISRELNFFDAFIDGYEGIIAVNPDNEKTNEYMRKINYETEFLSKINGMRSRDTLTADGKEINLCINIGKPSDLNGTEKTKFDGVGLFRTEFLYSSSRRKPSFDEQKNAYANVMNICENVTFRTIDIGGDKKLEYMDTGNEDNPFLGNRGIRLCLSHEDIFSEQLAAILAAGVGKHVKIMFPMVSSISEIKRAKELMEEVKSNLDRNGIEYSDCISTGIMIETPASAVMADILTEHADFFSIGTNDLVQYVMAADRGNNAVRNLYNPYHPAVIRLLANVIKCGNNAGIEVSVCGDLAANTDFTELFLGLGLKKFSVPFPLLDRIKYKISCINMEEAEKKAFKILSVSDEYESERIMKGEGHEYF